jgi:hypothetical protein
VKSTSPLSVFKDCLARDGVKGFYKGLDAALEVPPLITEQAPEAMF